MSAMTSPSARPGLIPLQGGYRNLKSFQLAELAQDVKVRFSDRCAHLNHERAEAPHHPHLTPGPAAPAAIGTLAAEFSAGRLPASVHGRVRRQFRARRTRAAWRAIASHP